MKIGKVIPAGFFAFFLCLVANLCQAQAPAHENQGGNWEFLMTRDILNDPAKCPWFADTYKNYTPDQQIVKAMSKLKKHVTFTIIGGLWCSDTQDLLPKFMKLTDQSGIKDDKLKLIGVDKDKKAQDGSTPFNVKNVPTFIIYYDGKEIGRVVESVQQSIEADIYGQLYSYVQLIGGDSK